MATTGDGEETGVCGSKRSRAWNKSRVVGGEAARRATSGPACAHVVGEFRPRGSLSFTRVARRSAGRPEGRALPKDGRTHGSRFIPRPLPSCASKRSGRRDGAVTESQCLRLLSAKIYFRACGPRLPCARVDATMLTVGAQHSTASAILAASQRRRTSQRREKKLRLDIQRWSGCTRRGNLQKYCFVLLRFTSEANFSRHFPRVYFLSRKFSTQIFFDRRDAQAFAR